jgi:WD40 repeat protein
MSRRAIPGLVDEVHNPWGSCRNPLAAVVLCLLAPLSAGHAQDRPALREAGTLVAPEVQAANSGLKQKAAIEYLTFSPDGKELFGGGPLAGVAWNVEKQQVATARGTAVRHPAYTKDGTRRLAYAGILDPNPPMNTIGDGFVTWDRKGKGELGKLLTQVVPLLPRGVPPPNIIGGGAPAALVFSLDGKLAVSPPIYRLGPKGNPPASNFQLRVYDVARGVELRSFALKHTAQIRCLSRSRDGKLVVSGSNDGTARVWSMVSGKELAVFKGHTSLVVAIAFSPDGERVASSGGKIGDSLHVWEAKTGKPIARFEGHPSPATSLAFTPDGKHVLSLGDFPKGNAALLWEAGTGTEVGRSPLRAVLLAIAPDGLVATTDPIAAGVVHLWRLP